jgi:hypothetical protein
MVQTKVHFGRACVRPAQLRIRMNVYSLSPTSQSEPSAVEAYQLRLVVSTKVTAVLHVVEAVNTGGKGGSDAYSASSDPKRLSHVVCRKRGVAHVSI